MLSAVIKIKTYLCMSVAELKMPIFMICLLILPHELAFAANHCADRTTLVQIQLIQGLTVDRDRAGLTSEQAEQIALRYATGNLDCGRNSGNAECIPSGPPEITSTISSSGGKSFLHLRFLQKCAHLLKEFEVYE